MSLSIIEMQTKTIISYHTQGLEEQKQTNQNDTQPTGEDAGQLECTESAGGKARLYGHSAKQPAVRKFLLRLNTHLQCDPVILLFAEVKW